jgi:hypothetical protein
MNYEILLTLFPILLIIIGSWSVIKPNHTHRINLSAWAVIVANAWLAALGTAFSEKSGLGAIYLLLNAAILTPILLLNLKRGAWKGLPSWQKMAVPILPLGGILGFYMGGEYATWTSCVVSCLLSIQLLEGVWKSISKESITTWSLFLASDSIALVIGWTSSNLGYKVLLSLWVLQCLGVIIISLFKRKSSTLRKLPYENISKRFSKIRVA